MKTGIPQRLHRVRRCFAVRALALVAIAGSALILLSSATAGSPPLPSAGLQHLPGDVSPALSGLRVPAGAPQDNVEVSPTGIMRVPPGTVVVPNRVLVRFRAGSRPASQLAARASISASVADAYSLIPRLQLLRLPPGRSVASAVSELSRDPSVQYAVPDLAVKVAAAPSDPLYSSQWALDAIGAPMAWSRTTGSATVKVAVLDTGVRLDHPDLTANLVPGWDFINNDSDPSDDYGHGTHVAGIIGAAGNNGVGVAGINWNVGIMPLKICDAHGSCDLAAEISALQYAVANGAKIANASFGGAYGGYQPERDAIAAAGAAGLLYVAAAGNSQMDNDLVPSYPASYPLDNIISVAATDSWDWLASFSNYGFNSVLTAAPGDGILSTMLSSGPLSDPSGYGTLSGTSMAAPQVSGAAALLWAQHPAWTMQQVRTRLLTTASPLPTLVGKVADCGQLDIAAATDTTRPDRGIVCVRLSGTGTGSVTSTPAGVDCGSTCVVSLPPGTTLSLSATPTSGSTFSGWGGDCSGSASCTVSAGLGRVTATFRASGSPGGWDQRPLPGPAGRDPFIPGSPLNAGTFYNVAVSADGSERAETIFNLRSNYCTYATDDTGGVFLERHTSSGWVADGTLTAPSDPAWSGDPGARWANCSSFGAVTKLSADGTALLVTPEVAPVWDPDPPRYRCAAYVYRRGDTGWALDAVLYPPGVDAHGSVTWEGCGGFGYGGAISNDGTRVAMHSLGLDSSSSRVLKVDVFVRSGAGWSLEQQLTLPTAGEGCAGSIGSRYLSLSGDGSTLLAASPDCPDAGYDMAGLVYAYERSGSVWTLGQTIHPPDPYQYMSFGAQTALSQDGNTATIEAPLAWSPGGFNGGGVWIYERDESGWHASEYLPPIKPDPDSLWPLSCPTIVQNGARIVCNADAPVGFNYDQGSLYVYDRPGGGWGNQHARRMFASDGLAGDYLGSTIGAPEDGSFFDATISPINLATSAYPHDRIGYEFFRTTSPEDNALTVTSAGEGSGSVVSNPSGIDCGETCWLFFADSTPVTLTATPATGSTFTGWSGACSGTGTCTVTMDADREITATFARESEKLTVSKAGSGSGTVSSSPGGISCGATCSHDYLYGDSVTLTATPATGSAFSGWSGACSGTGTCTVTLTADASVTATFALNSEVLQVVSAGSGSGTVTSAPAGISCGSTCSHAFSYGNLVTLTAVPAIGSTFTGWSGACSGTSTCTVTMTADKSVTATFALSHVPAGSGSGTATGTPAGISSATGKIKSAKLSKKTFTASQAKNVKLTVKFGPKSKVFKWVVSLKLGSKWKAVKNVAKHGSFSTKTMTVKQLFGGKKMVAGVYQLRLSADKNAKTLKFRIV